MERKLFYLEDEDTIIGYSSDIIADTIQREKKIIDTLNDEEALSLIEGNKELIDELLEYDNVLVKCHYHPMGSWFVCRLVEE